MSLLPNDRNGCSNETANTVPHGWTLGRHGEVRRIEPVDFLSWFVDYIEETHHEMSRSLVFHRHWVKSHRLEVFKAWQWHEAQAGQVELPEVLTEYLKRSIRIAGIEIALGEHGLSEVFVTANRLDPKEDLLGDIDFNSDAGEVWFDEFLHSDGGRWQEHWQACGYTVADLAAIASPAARAAKGLANPWR